MSLQLKHREKDNMWRAWTTMSDAWLTDWMSESEMKAYLVWRRERRYKLDVIEIIMSFPHGYSKKDDSLRAFRGPITDFYDWHTEILNDHSTYDDKIDQKYNELTKGLEE